MPLPAADAVRADAQLAPRPSTTPLTRHRKPLPALTGVRFFAAIYVVLFHGDLSLGSRFDLPGPLATFLSNGYLAVTLFFILSGFILAYTYQDQIDDANGRVRFWEARFARIYPVYAFSLLASLGMDRVSSLWAKLSVLFMVQAWNPFAANAAGAWNFPAWTLSVEALFYLCFPFLLPMLARCSTNMLNVFRWALLAIVVFGHTPLFTLSDPTGSTILGRYLPLPVTRLPEFLLGVMLGLIFLRSDHGRARRYVPEGAAVVALALLCVPLGRWVSLVGLPFAVLVYELAFGTGWLARLLSSRVVVLLGGASYAIYLLQAPVARWTLAASAELLPRSSVVGVYASPFVLILLSIVVFVYLEEPSRRALRKWFAARRSLREAACALREAASEAQAGAK